MTTHTPARRAPIRTLACCATLALAAGIAQAQPAPGQVQMQTLPGGPTAGSGSSGAGGQRPPRVGNVEDATTILHFAVGIGVIALCVGVVIIPGRRDHDE
ncbi:MAG: hypothetical protein AAGH64_11570 [Planctomycetota bacterium]